MPYCNSCGSEISADAAYCPDCGGSTSGTESPEPDTTDSGSSFGSTARKVVSIVFVIIGLLIALGGLGTLYELILFRDMWSLSMTLSYAIFAIGFLGVAKFIYPD